MIHKYAQERCENTIGVIRRRKSKYIQYNGQKKNGKQLSKINHHR